MRFFKKIMGYCKYYLIPLLLCFFALVIYLEITSKYVPKEKWAECVLICTILMILLIKLCKKYYIIVVALTIVHILLILIFCLFIGCILIQPGINTFIKWFLAALSENPWVSVFGIIFYLLDYRLNEDFLK